MDEARSVHDGRSAPSSGFSRSECSRQVHGALLFSNAMGVAGRVAPPEAGGG